MFVRKGAIVCKQSLLIFANHVEHLLTIFCRNDWYRIHRRAFEPFWWCIRSLSLIKIKPWSMLRSYTDTVAFLHKAKSKHFEREEKTATWFGQFPSDIIVPACFGKQETVELMCITCSAKVHILWIQQKHMPCLPWVCVWCLYMNSDIKRSIKVTEAQSSQTIGELLLGELLCSRNQTRRAPVGSPEQPNLKT